MKAIRLFFLLAFVLGVTVCRQYLEDDFDLEKHSHKAPQVFHLQEVPAEARQFQEDLLKYKEFAPGKSHKLEHYHYDEEAGIFRYQFSEFKINNQFFNLDQEKAVESLKCSKDSDVKTLRIYTNTEDFTLEVGTLVAFGPQWKAGCHRHHNNGKKGFNLFELTEVSEAKESDSGNFVITATIQTADPTKVFENADFNSYQENLRLPEITAENDAFYEESEASGGERKKLSDIRKRHLPQKMIDMIETIRVKERRKTARHLLQKRGFWDALVDAAKSVGGAIKAGIEKAAQTVQNAYEIIKKEGGELLDWTKKKVTEWINGEHSVEFKPELKLSHTEKFGPLNLKAELSFGLILGVHIHIADFSLEKVKLETVGQATGTLTAWFGVTAKFEQEFKLPISVSAPGLIPTPIIGVFIKVEPYLKVGGKFAAEFKAESSKIVAKATGKVGATNTYESGIWTNEPVQSFTYSVDIPEPKFTVEAKVTLTITPSIGCNLGASAVGIIDLTGGPMVAVPLTIGAYSNLEDCALQFKFSWQIDVGIKIAFSVLGHDLLSKTFKVTAYGPNEYKIGSCLVPLKKNRKFRKF